MPVSPGFAQPDIRSASHMPFHGPLWHIAVRCEFRVAHCGAGNGDRWRRYMGFLAQVWKKGVHLRHWKT